MRWSAPALAAVAISVLLAGCGGDGDDGAADQRPAETGGAGFAVRPALSDPAPTPCERDLALEESGALCDLDGLAIEVGPAAVVGGVVSARGVELSDGSWGVEIELDGDSAAALEELTRSVTSSQSRIAIVIGGEVVAAPTVAGVIGAGTLQVAGDWSEQAAADLADRAQTLP